MAERKGKMGSALVRSINPRLESYSKPLLLAVIILVLTLGLTAGLFAIQISNCPTVSTISLDLVFGDMDQQSDAYRKKLEQAGTQGGTTTTVNICLKSANELIAVGHPNYVDSLTSPSAVGYNPCSLDADALADLGLTMCTTTGVSHAENCATAEVECRPCGDVQGDGTRANAGSGGATLRSQPFITSTETEVSNKACPPASTALGAALGYATYIELIVTILLVAGLKACGVIQVVDPRGSMVALAEGAVDSGVSRKDFEKLQAEVRLQKGTQQSA